MTLELYCPPKYVLQKDVIFKLEAQLTLIRIVMANTSSCTLNSIKFHIMIINLDQSHPPIRIRVRYSIVLHKSLNQFCNKHILSNNYQVLPQFIYE